MKSAIKVAIVEDDNNLQLLYKTKLAHDGFEVYVAANGEDGLSVIERCQPDVVLLDLLMPVMGGQEMLSRLRSTDWGSKIRVIVLTNISKDEAPPTLRFLNVDRYVVKAHHTPAQIVAVIHEVLGTKSR